MRALSIILAVLLAGCASVARYQFHPASDTISGPEMARGAVIYSHGTTYLRSGEQGADAPPPVLLTTFEADGWDTYRLDRERFQEDRYDAADKLVQLAHDLRQRGYKRIVLIGQSGGAWMSLMAAAKTTEVDEVIALAPAYFGENGTANNVFELNRTELVKSVRDIRHGIIVAAFFRGDTYDPEGRSAQVEQVLAGSGVSHLVIDHPAGLIGHHAGQSGAFAERFGSCLISIADTGVIPSSCDAWVRAAQ